MYKEMSPLLIMRYINSHNEKGEIDYYNLL